MNGKQVVNYHGALGYGARTYWLQGLYRSPMPKTVATYFRNLMLTTGSSRPGVSLTAT
jgi:hypothetical protein